MRHQSIAISKKLDKTENFSIVVYHHDLHSGLCVRESLGNMCKNNCDVRIAYNNFQNIIF